MRLALLTQATPLPECPTVGLYNVAQAKALGAMGVTTSLISVAPRLPRGAAFLGGPFRRQANRPTETTLDGITVKTVRARTAFPKIVRSVVAPRIPDAVAKQFACAAGDKLLHELERFMPSAILAHGMLPWGRIALDIGSSLGVPVGFIEHSYEDTMRIRAGSPLHRYSVDVAAQARCLLTVSSTMANHLASLGIGRPRALLNGVALLASEPPQPECADFVVLCAGAYHNRKGHAVLIEAFARAAIPNSRLQLVGQPPQRILDQIKGAGIEEAVEVLPTMSNSDLLRAMSRADLFALPSWAEAFGLVYFESLGAGTPVLLTTDSGAAEHITQGREGWVVPPNDPDATAAALRSAHEAGARRRAQMGRMGHRMVERKFSWARNASELASHLGLTDGSATVHDRRATAWAHAFSELASHLGTTEASATVHARRATAHQITAEASPQPETMIERKPNDGALHNDVPDRGLHR